MIKKLFIFVFLGLMCQVLPAATDRQMVDGIAARVNDRVVTIGEALMLMRPMHEQLADRFSGRELEAMLATVYEGAVEQLVDKELILDAYEKQESKLPDWLIENRISRIIREVFNDDRRELEKVLERDGVTMEEWRSEIRDQLIVTSMRNAMVDQHVTVSPLAVRRYYEKHRDEFMVSGKVRLRMITIKRFKGSEADMAAQQDGIVDIRKRIAEGEPFPEVARRFSEGARAEDGGDWGWIDPGILRRELADAVKGMKEAEVSGIVQTDDAFYILKIEGRKAGDEPAFEDAEPRIVEELKNQRAEVLYKGWVERLKKDAQVQVFDIEIFQ